MSKKLVLILDKMNKIERQTRKPLAHDGGRLLRWMLDRLSISRDAWVHTYVSQDAAVLPTTKAERLEYLDEYRKDLLQFLYQHRPFKVICMGKLACEALLDVSSNKYKIGLYEEPLYSFVQAGAKRVWITYTPDAALFDPEKVVDISRVVWRACIQAGIECRIDYSLPMYDWSKYL